MFHLQNSSKIIFILTTLLPWLLVLYCACDVNALRSDSYILPKCCENTRHTYQMSNSTTPEEELNDLCGSGEKKVVFLPAQLFHNGKEALFEQSENPNENTTEQVQVRLEAKHVERLECNGNYEDFTMEFDDARLKKDELFSDRGLLVHNGYFFDQSQFCIRRVSENSVTVRTCKEECSAKRPCINRCCFGDSHFVLDSALKFFNIKRLKCEAPDTDINNKIKWSPPFYNSIEDTFPTVMTMSDSVQPLMRKRRPRGSGCYLHRSFLNKTPFVSPFKLLRTGVLMGRWLEKTWKKLELKRHCLEPVMRRGKSGKLALSGNSEEFVVWLCREDWNFVEPRPIPYRFYTATVLLSIALSFYMGIAVIYILRKDKDVVFRWSIVSYSSSLTCTYGIVVYLFAKFLLPQAIGTYRQGDFTPTTVAILVMLACFIHVFGFSWVAVLSFDVWLTLTFLRHGKKNPKRLYLYLAFTFTLTCVIFVAASIKDINYSHLELIEVIGGRGVFLHLMFGSLVVFSSINFLLFIATAVKLWIAQHSSQIKRTDTKTFVLNLKLFLLMGFRCIIDFLVGAYFVYTDLPYEPNLLVITIIEATSLVLMALHPVFLFIFLVWNSETKRYMESNYPRIKGVMDFIDKICYPVRWCLGLCKCPNENKSGTSDGGINGPPLDSAYMHVHRTRHP